MTVDFGKVAADLWSARRHRDAVLGSHMAGEGGWDILLYLYAATTIERRVSVSEACSASGVAPTTGLRAISVIIRQGLVVRVPDSSDRRRAFLELTIAGRSKVERAMTPPKRVGRGLLDQTKDGRIILKAAAPRGSVPSPVILLQQALAILTEANHHD